MAALIVTFLYLTFFPFNMTVEEIAAKVDERMLNRWRSISTNKKTITLTGGLALGAVAGAVESVWLTIGRLASSASYAETFCSFAQILIPTMATTGLLAALLTMKFTSALYQAVKQANPGQR